MLNANKHSTIIYELGRDRDNTDSDRSRASAREVPFEFRGVGSGVFQDLDREHHADHHHAGNLFAWATVRTNRYFYANTYLDSESFRYLADPITILKGINRRGGLYLLFVASNLFPVVGVLLAIALLFALPFFVIRSIAFSNRMTAYRNVQFRFKGTYGGAFLALLVWPMLGVLTLGILYPLALLKANQFVVSNCAYGATPFSFEEDLGLR